MTCYDLLHNLPGLLRQNKANVVDIMKAYGLDENTIFSHVVDY